MESISVTNLGSDFAFENIWQVYLAGLINPKGFGKRALNSPGILKPFILAIVCIALYALIGAFATQWTDLAWKEEPLLIGGIEKTRLSLSLLFFSSRVLLCFIPMLILLFYSMITISLLYYLLFRMAGLATVQLDQIYKIIFYPHAFLVLSAIPLIGSILGAAAVIFLIYKGISSLGLPKSHKIANFALVCIYFIMLNLPFVLRAFIIDLISRD